MGARTKSPATRDDEKPILIEKVLAEVQKALESAQSKIGNLDFPPLDSVVVTLQTAISIGFGGKIKWIVFTAGMTWEKETSQELVFNLTPPPSPSRSVKSLADHLANAIVDAAKGVQKAVTGKPPLLLSSFNAIVSFLVTWEISGGAQFQLEPVNVELLGKLKHKALHRIELRFKRK